MKKLYITCMIVFLISIPTLTLYLNSETNIIYVNQEYGSDLNSGEKSSPFASINKAIGHISQCNSECAKIILTADYIIDRQFEFTEAEHKNTNIEISSEDKSSLILKNNSSYSLSGSTTFKNINITTEGKVSFIANFNPITFDENVNTISLTSTKDINIIGGYKAYKESLPTDKSSNITVKSGNIFNTVIGFTAEKGDCAVSFEGTSIINIHGGSIEKVLCASDNSHFSKSTVLNIYGGNITSVYTGGSASRRLYGEAEVSIHGGKISSLTLNNVIGNSLIRLIDGSVDNFTLFYANTSIINDAINSKIEIEYNNDLFTEAINSFKNSSLRYSINIILYPYSESTNQASSSTDVPIISETTVITAIPPQTQKVTDTSEYTEYTDATSELYTIQTSADTSSKESINAQTCITRYDSASSTETNSINTDENKKRNNFYFIILISSVLVSCIAVAIIIWVKRLKKFQHN